MSGKKILFLFILFIVIAAATFGFTRNNSPVPASPPVSYNSPMPTKNDVLSESTGTARIKQPAPQTPPEMTLDKTMEYFAVLDTDKGKIKIELFADKTPITVNNFVVLSQSGFYNQTIFHRVINGFMIQGGDPQGTGAGGPGYRFDDEPFTGEYTRGTVAMANAGPDTNGSQFFIMHQDNDLPQDYVIFGKVVDGLDIVDAIAESPVVDNNFGESSRPLNPVKVKSVEIVNK